MRNEIDIKEKSRGAIRNISGLNEEFQGMKLQFHRDGTPVSSHETPAHTSKNHPVFRNLSLLTLLLLFFSAGWNENVVWGQTGTTILAAGNRDTVHTRTEIIYVDPNKSRVLSLPELKINDGSGYGGDSYRWYVHWYGSTKGTIAGTEIYLDADEAQKRGGLIKGGTYLSDLHNAKDGLWWYEGFYNESMQDGKWAHLSSCASTITYTLTGNLNEGDDELICDVSNYQDYIKNDDTQFTEPTLLKRYRYIIRLASKCADVLKERPLEDYNIDYPKESAGTINLSMLSLPENYFWYKNGESGELISGETFIYSLGVKDYASGSYKKFNQLQVQQMSDLSGDEPQIVYVRAINGTDVSPVLAKYTFNPKSDTGFILDGNTIPDYRTPEKHTDLYEEIGVVDFDQNDAEPTLSKENNMADKPMPQEETVYGFMFNNVASVRKYLTPGQNQYGLYRSANVSGISRNSDMIGSKSYRWMPPLMDSLVNKTETYRNRILYDRTYERTKNSYGFFYYIDASDDPGTLVNVPIKGTLCGYTELVVTAWLADMTRPLQVSGDESLRKPLAPNINLILKGIDPITREEVVLHYFTSGDAKTSYTGAQGINENLMKWQQLCYRITLTEDVENYTDFHLEVQNNEPHTDGADYAIDDVRIYKTLPNIKVRRENNCDASTLIVGTDYSTILRNMGWSAGEEVAKRRGG